MIEGRVLSDATWFKSSYSATQDECVEVAITSTAIGVRDTKDRDGGTLVFDNTTWSTFLTHLRTPTN
ncbi:DUF397 domain-containing protein [Saccharopolyspora aridisoli]|uniref:DUF397 domain-containing protein n=1 Tax=Saccharopolyspora aridisoli TaxID=2530385 RepID=A0A4R4V0L5_9PSEU|nr:DUF397 domain-containing protein [Saccharopolyspora aridisoli]TDC94743.1 DUF397 domain-containing protein [Saccharopolyspora aridisoli]